MSALTLRVIEDFLERYAARGEGLKEVRRDLARGIYVGVMKRRQLRAIETFVASRESLAEALEDVSVQILMTELHDDFYPHHSTDFFVDVAVEFLSKERKA